MSFPFLASWPEISLQFNLRLSVAKLKANDLSMQILNECKVESELERNGSILIFLNDLELMREEIEIGELSLKKEGVCDDVVSIVSCLQGNILFTLHL